MAPLRLIVLLPLLAGAAPALAAEISSAYTKIDLAACREVPPDPDDPLQSGAWWCEGYGGMPVYVMEGDLRFYVSYGEGADTELAASETLPAFNHIGETVEWRIAGGIPLATILRFYTDAGEGQPEGQMLVITRLGDPGQVCQLGYVDARVNPDANAIARQVADTADSFVCGRDQVLQYGLVGNGGDAEE